MTPWVTLWVTLVLHLLQCCCCCWLLLRVLGLGLLLLGLELHEPVLHVLGLHGQQQQQVLLLAGQVRAQVQRQQRVRVLAAPSGPHQQ